MLCGGRAVTSCPDFARLRQPVSAQSRVDRAMPGGGRAWIARWRDREARAPARDDHPRGADPAEEPGRCSAEEPGRRYAEVGR